MLGMGSCPLKRHAAGHRIILPTARGFLKEILSNMGIVFACEPMSM